MYDVSVYCICIILYICYACLFILCSYLIIRVRVRRMYAIQDSGCKTNANKDKNVTVYTIYIFYKLLCKIMLQLQCLPVAQIQEQYNEGDKP